MKEERVDSKGGIETLWEFILHLIGVALGDRSGSGRIGSARSHNVGSNVSEPT